MFKPLDCEELQKYYEASSIAITEDSEIEPGMYSKYNVKRGLRNENGTGVLVGLTEIGEVHAYVMEDNEKVPVDGRLIYRGINVYDLVEGFISEDRFGFEECVYLLLFGNLPTKEKLNEFSNVLAQLRTLPDGFVRDIILKAPSTDIMNKLARSVLTAYSYDFNPDDNSIPNLVRQSLEIIARFPLLAPYAYQAKSHYHHGKSLIIHKPRPEMSTAENLLCLSRADSTFTKLEATTLDLALVLHAEHGGGNNSTFTSHVVASSGTDIYSCIAASLGSLKGPKHGGANLKVMGMMEEMKESVKNWASDGDVADYLTKVLKKQAFDKSGLIYGIGHAVYTKSDPRCILLKKKAGELAIAKGRGEEYELYKTVEKLAPEVFYNVKKSDKVMCANVDFYAGFVYNLLDIPIDLNTPIFATARVPGWCAHIIEEVINGGKIIRPAYKNVKGRLKYIPMNER